MDTSGLCFGGGRGFVSRGVFLERVLRSFEDVFRFLKSTRAILFNSINWSPMLD